MAENFATIEDLKELWRPLQNEEIVRAQSLLRIVSNSLREEGLKVGKDLDKLVLESPSYADVVRSVTVDVVARTLMTATDQEPMTQTTESALGYSLSASYLVPGGGLFIKNTELSRLGFRRQKYGVVNFYDFD